MYFLPGFRKEKNGHILRNHSKFCMSTQRYFFITITFAFYSDSFSFKQDIFVSIDTKSSHLECKRAQLEYVAIQRFRTTLMQKI